MAEKIDELLVEIGFDVKKALEGVKKLQDGMDKTGKSGEATNKKLESSASGAAKAFSAIRNEIILIGGALVGLSSIKSFFSNSVDEMSKLKFLSETMGIATERIQEYTTAAEKMGSSGGDIINMLSNVSQAVADYQKGLGTFAGSDGAFGVAGLIGGVGAPETLTAEKGIRAYADALRAAYAKSNAIGQQFAQEHGISPSLIPLLKQGGAEFEKFVQAQAKYATVSKKDADAAQELNKQLIDIKKSFEAAGNEIVVAMIDPLKEVLKAFQGLGDWILANKDDIAKTIGAWATAIVEFSKLVLTGHIKEALGSWAERFEKIVNALNTANRIGNELQVLSNNEVAPEYSGNDNRNYAERTGITAAAAVAVAGISGYMTGKPEAEMLAAAKRNKLDYFKLKDLYNKVGNKYGVNGDVLLAQAFNESHFNPYAVNKKSGASGINQFMPGTAKQYGLQNPFDIETSADAAGRLMRDLLKVNHGNYDLALAEYNAGGVAIRGGGKDRHGRYHAPHAPSIPNWTETRNYHKEILGRARAIQSSKMAQGGNTGPTFNLNGPLTVVADNPEQFANKLPSKVVPQMARAQR